MSNSEIFWDKRSKTYDDNNVGKPNPAREQKIARTKALLSESDLVLDFACGTGEISLAIAPAVHQVQGIDLSPAMIELARKKKADRGAANVIFDKMEAFDHRLDPWSVTAILAFNVLHVMDDPAKVLARLNDLLAPGGVLISETPALSDGGWVMRSMLGLAQKVRWAPAIQNFTVADIEALVTNAKFHITESKNYDGRQVVQWIVARKAS